MDIPTNPSHITKTEIELRNKLIVSNNLTYLDDTMINNLNILLKSRSEAAKAFLSVDMKNELWDNYRNSFIYYNDLIKSLLGI